MKIAVILGSMSVGSRPLDFWYNNIFESPRGATGTDIAFCMLSKELQKRGHEIYMFTVHAQPEHKPDVWECCKLYNLIDKHTVIDYTFDTVISINEPDDLRGINCKGPKICYQFLNDYTYCLDGFDDYVDHWINVCESHKNYLSTQARSPNINKCSVIPLGVDPNWYTDQRVPGRVIWTSSADRGLHNLLEIWPKIKAAVPYASLKIFYHFEYGDLLKIEPHDLNNHFHRVEVANRLRYIVESIKRLQYLDVEHCKSISREQMVKEMSEASVFAFPCDTVATTEGFSVSTLESHASFTVPVITNQDCLGSIYNDSGAIVIKSPVKNNLSEFTDAVIKGLTDKTFADGVIEKCREFSFNHTWANSANKLEKIILQHPKLIKKLPKLKIGIVATHSFPIPYPNIHTGDIVILDLANALQDMGHQVTLYAPDGTNFSNIRTTTASFGKCSPTPEQCEIECFNNHKDSLLTQDIVHDFSITKYIANNLNNSGYLKTCCTLMGGAWTQNIQPKNLITWSNAHQERVLRGATDYENTPTPNLDGTAGVAVKDVSFIYGGINTEFYSPMYDKEDYFLWMGRWHMVRGYKTAIEIARKSGINLILAGDHPDNEIFESQRACALEAIELAKDLPNVKFKWLPKDPYHHIAKINLYQKAKAFLYTVQFHEPFGLSQAESLACGTPVIGTNYGSIPEVIKHGVTGFVCDDNVDSFIEAITKINDIDCKSCRKDAVERFDIKIMAQEYLKQYYKIIEK